MSLCRQSFLLLRRSVVQNVCFRVTETRNIKRWVSPTLKELKRRRDKIGPEPEKPRSSFLEWNYEAEIYAFGKRLGEEFDKKLLKQALIQREYANMQEFKAKEQVIVPLINFQEFPVSKETLSNTFKAVVAVLKRSKDLNRAQIFVKDFVLSQMNGKDVYELWDPQNPYEYLTTLLNEKGITEIEPRLCNQSAVNTILANFQVGLYSNRKLLGIGWGENIKIAKETAALDAIQRIYKDYVPK
ncbi:hypothetical protein NQ314_013795 [Rhamnusium bicolor]|uniref:39S ribosomal protein L44, mitochondrial n=1 Tax=Rhamnusium bicolor TaxID=1586634 RepID=A0AAV8X734_9CUCU|nr:hypothetical protein NQ314_013795 [Rhamnusium bicolor]